MSGGETDHNPGVYTLPPLPNKIQGRFDPDVHPLFGELNGVLDQHGQHHWGPEKPWGTPGTYTDPNVGGDPYYLSNDLSEYAKRFAAHGEFGHALTVLDQGVRWNDTALSGVQYGDLARAAATAGETDFALAILLDDDRIMARYSPRPVEQTPPDPDFEYRTADFAHAWLSRAASVYLAMKEHGDRPISATEAAFRAKVEKSLQILEENRVEGQLPLAPHASEGGTNWLATGLGLTCAWFSHAGETAWAERILNLDPMVRASQS